MNIQTILMLAFFAEGTTEYIFGKSQWFKPYVLYISLLVGIAISFAYNVNVFQALGFDLNSAYTWVDNVVSGVMIGRGSNYFNDLISFVQAIIKNKVATAKEKIADLELQGIPAKDVTLDSLSK